MQSRIAVCLALAALGCGGGSDGGASGKAWFDGLFNRGGFLMKVDEGTATLLSVSRSFVESECTPSEGDWCIIKDWMDDVGSASVAADGSFRFSGSGLSLTGTLDMDAITGTGSLSYEAQSAGCTCQYAGDWNAVADACQAHCESDADCTVEGESCFGHCCAPGLRMCGPEGECAIDEDCDYGVCVQSRCCSE